MMLRHHSGVDAVLIAILSCVNAGLEQRYGADYNRCLR